MIKLYHAGMTRSARVRWLLEELDLRYELVTVDFAPPEKGWFGQQTPLGKLPVIEDDGMVMCESGAIVEYIVDRYGDGRLAPPVASPQRGPYLQWIHYSEGTAYPPIGTIIFHTFYRKDAAEIPAVIDDARVRARASLDFLAREMGDPWVLGANFSAADVMLGYTLAVARFVELLGDFPKLGDYLALLEARPAFQRATAV